MKKSKRRNPIPWIQNAIKGKTRWSLHRQLGVPDDEKIPTQLLQEAAKHPKRFEASSEAAARLLALRARLALTLRGFGKKRSRKR